MEESWTEISEERTAQGGLSTETTVLTAQCVELNRCFLGMPASDDQDELILRSDSPGSLVLPVISH